MTMARVTKGIISTYEGKKEAEDDESVVSDVNENLTPTKKHLRKKTPAQNQEVKYKSVIAVEKEIETYRNHPPSPQDQSVLLWWKSHQDILPRLSVLASYILAIPASSSASERLFSIAGTLLLYEGNWSRFFSNVVF